MYRSTWLHLRFPFSFFLLPVFLFAWSIGPAVAWDRVAAVFVILHLLLYPASNGYNSWFDKDEDSIGGLKHPPQVKQELYWVSLLLDGLALLWGLWLGWPFALMLLGYGLVSKAYSHPAIRLKKMPYLGWLAAGLFQGYFTFVMVYVGLQGSGWEEAMVPAVQWPAALSSLMLLGSYPMTQVYQHEADAARGDLTLSRRLGILGTFHFTALIFALASLGFIRYYHSFWGSPVAWAFGAALLPVLGYFGYWYALVWRDRQRADYLHTMRLNFISSLMLNLFYGGLVLVG